MTYNPLIKICGLKTPEAIDAAISGGASHVGFIFFPKSPRHISDLNLASQLAKHVSGRAKIVPVTVNASDEELKDIIAAMQPDMLQLHGKEDHARISHIKEMFELPIIKALSISSQADLEAIEPLRGTVDLFLLDAKPPKTADLPGGNGISFDWEILKSRSDLPSFLLSGGLRLDNLEAALKSVKPAGIDLSSGVESAPGVKDISLIEKFLHSVRYIVQDIT